MRYSPTAMTAAVPAVDDATFEQLVIQARQPVLVEFWAPWCGPCRMIAPIVTQLAAENTDRLTVLSLNTDENPATASALRILGLPTVRLYDQGRLVREVRGARPKAYLRLHLAGYLNE